ncbi:MAG TPA: hypothetical protein VIV12_09770 [Streptosporangiaceae bacterium]
MTASYARRPQVLPRPACTPAAIRAVLAANADPAVLSRYDSDLDAAFEKARELGHHAGYTIDYVPNPWGRFASLDELAATFRDFGTRRCGDYAPLYARLGTGIAGDHSLRVHALPPSSKSSHRNCAPALPSNTTPGNGGGRLASQTASR